MNMRQKLLWLGYTIGLATSITACQPAQPVSLKPLAPLPQDPKIQVYTNHNPAQRFKDIYLQRDRFGDDLEQVIVDAINTAQTSIDVAVQELRLPRIAQALRDRQKAGITVRVVIENTYRKPMSAWRDDDLEKLSDRERNRIMEGRQLIDQNHDGQLSPDEISQNDALVTIAEANIPLLDDTADGSKGSNLMHHKFVVVDGHTVIVTSANFTISDMVGDFQSAASTGNANTLLKIQSPELAQAFLEEFNLLWGDGPGGLPNSQFGTHKPHRAPKTITIGNTQVDFQFSPSAKTIPWESSTNGLISRTLQSAQQSIDLALFVFSDQALVNALEPLHEKGIKTRALIDSGFIYRPYSNGLDMLGITLDPSCKHTASKHIWAKPAELVGTPKMPPGDLLHHKFGIIDRQTVIVGSHNWTEAANHGNDEVLLVIHNPTVAAHYQREFDRLTTGAFFGIPPAIAQKVDQTNCPAATTNSATSASTTEPSTTEPSTTEPSEPSTTSVEADSTPPPNPHHPKHHRSATSNHKSTPHHKSSRHRTQPPQSDQI
jgi:phosphatidylserine/phosphatidylglycerophosphate/cardiolipin synthase-like enzyme